MSKLEELIQELCPNGVEYKPLLSVANVLYGFPCDASLFNSDGLGKPLARIRDVLNGFSDTFTTQNVPKKYFLTYGDLLVGMDGNFHVSNWKDTDGILCQRVCKFESIDEKSIALNKYLSHLLKPIIKKIELNKPSGTVKHLLDKDIKSIMIPVPPLEIQQEIVRILDNFTELTTELTTELIARKKQYEYYRNTLLDFTVNSPLLPIIQELCPDGVEYKALGNLGKFYGGLTGKTKDDFKDGNAKFITYKNVYFNPALDIDVEDRVKIRDNENQRTLQYGDIIFTGSSETPDECGITSVVTTELEENLYLNSFCFFFRFDELEIMYPEFSKHLFRSSNLRHQIGKTASGVTRFNVSKKLMEKVVIPVPPLEVQREIVRILDKFDVLCSDISTGLPAEIEARQKQYEYYRDKLLTFKELS